MGSPSPRTLQASSLARTAWHSCLSRMRPSLSTKSSNSSPAKSARGPTTSKIRTTRLCCSLGGFRLGRLLLGRFYFLRLRFLGFAKRVIYAVNEQTDTARPEDDQKYQKEQVQEG